ncbi:MULTISPECIES: spore cortex-lytic enzyme [Brevibacillus]|jgi:N-acetylmuramoyl-L-alanine amidase|uniref:Spore cortex-lytic enzyme n=1 Tax=Brevibacillus borstelensis AK1 TaxID=1300222 RepID=M8DBX1_9BACL|nr:spore cortex-lytic enzyme [Brevibacillus borstelensis]EMT53794.1 spore cortex-lytic enzyme precursor [Brevibacillus borstelensis AK1]KKX56802.1 hydrolase [Brevibacillus borstelensis cifa_chp40]MBE5394707.1 spore cortex-lytic enzyme [Brevibacillus borstelensis]MCC0562534.1 spore cortex-lytic enzyme [Brevibacillus borstelensis]MCM3469858.1 spore cortex-lytic enzyme [Brevibacillus borstelensis]
MKQPVKWLLCLLALALTVTASVMISPVRTDAFSNQEVRVGATGKDVREMQGRLKYLGFYTGKVDGVFSWRSYWALRNFQYEFGLKVDGILGPKTKLKLYNATTGYRPTAEELGVEPAPAAPAPSAPKNTSYRSKGITDNDIRLMANAVHGEARGEPYVGQVAVAAVILNRTRNPAFPNSPAGVIFEPRAFTAVADGQIWLTPNETAKKAVQDALNGWDPTGGAIYYFNPDTATSAWIWSRPQIKKIGKHIFCR